MSMPKRVVLYKNLEMPIENTSGASLTQTIYQHLWHQIAHLELLPGEKLSEVRLSKEFSCSRIPVREAIQLLVANGALEVQPQKGSFVTYIDIQRLERIRYIREALECKVILDGLQSNAYESAIPFFESLVARQEELAMASASELLFQLDSEFHKMFFTLTKKEFVLAHTGEKDIHYLRARMLAICLDKPSIVIEQHRAILEAIKNKDVAALEYAIHVHLNNVLTVYREHYDVFAPYMQQNEAN